MFFQIQEWVAPPIAGAGQLLIPKVPRSGSQITSFVWAPRSSTVFEDDYDEDPRFFANGVRETVGTISGEKLSETPEIEEANDRYIVSDNGEENSQGMEESIGGGPSDKDNAGSAPKLKDGPVAQRVGTEESLHLSMDKGSRLILGPFGARRTCYHYRPQVKRCVTSLFRTPLRKVLPGSFCCVNKQQASYPNSSSISRVCKQSQPDHKKLYPRKSSCNKRFCISRTCHSHTSIKAHSRMLEGSVPHRFSCLMRKKNIHWKVSVHPHTYERILWRLPSSLWKQLELCLTHFEDDDALHFLTPVMYSLRRFSGLTGSRMVYSLSQDSYGVSERAWEDLVMALCMCCVLVFMYRVYGGVHDCVTGVLDWISW